MAEQEAPARHNMVTAQDLMVEPLLPDATELNNSTARIVDGVIYVVRGNSWHRMDNEGVLPTTPIPEVPPQPVDEEGHPVELSYSWDFRYVHSGRPEQFLVPVVNQDYGEPWVRVAPNFPDVSPRPFTDQGGRMISQLTGTLVLEAVMGSIVDVPEFTQVDLWLDQDNGAHTHLLRFHQMYEGITFASVQHNSFGPRAYANEAVVHLDGGERFSINAEFTSQDGTALSASEYPESFVVTINALPMMVSFYTDPDDVPGWDTRIEPVDPFFTSELGEEDVITPYLLVQAGVEGGTGNRLAQVVRFVKFSSTSDPDPDRVVETRTQIPHDAGLHDVYMMDSGPTLIPLTGITLEEDEVVEVEVVYTVFDDDVGTAVTTLTRITVPSGGIAG